jgi:hypothetical protein
MLLFISKDRMRLSAAMMFVFITFMILVVASSAQAEDPPTISFVSEGGLISGEYVLNVSVPAGGISSVTYWVDEGTPVPMAPTTDTYYEATIDTLALTEGDHVLNIKATYMTGETLENSTDIAIDRNSPAVGVISEFVIVGGDFVFSATAEDVYLNTSAVYALIDEDEAAAVDNVMTSEDDHFEFVIDTTMMDEGGHTVRVWAFDLWGSSNKSQAIGFEVDNIAPSVEIVFEGGTVWGEYVFRVAVTDANLDANSITASIDGGDPITMPGGDGEWETTINTSELANGDVTISASASDLAGNTNSTESITITVANLPDLEIISVEWVNTRVTKGGTISVNVSILNSGTVASGAFAVSMMSGSEILATASDTTGLDADASEVYTIEWEAMEEGEWTATLVVDQADDIAEIDETDNEWATSEDLKVEALPDLEITGVNWITTKVKEGGTISVKVTIMNSGAVASGAFVVSMISGNETLASTSDATGLDAGASKDYTIKWKANKDGKWTATLVVDQPDDVAEIDETDNEWAAPEDLKVEAEAESPGMGASFLILAMIGVFAVLRRRS